MFNSIEFSAKVREMDNRNLLGQFQMASDMLAASGLEQHDEKWDNTREARRILQDEILRRMS